MDMAVEVADILPKGKFAELINVSAGRVSQYITERKIYGEAIVGNGRSAKINVPIAQQQLRKTLDVAQSLGNGLDTDLGSIVQSAPGSTESRSAEDLPATSSVEDQIRAEKLKTEQLRVRRLEEDEALRQGRYVLANDARAEQTRQAGLMLKVFEGGLADMATGIAAEFKLPQRDVLHCLKASYRQVRNRAAKDFEKAAAELPANVEDETED